MRLCHECGNIRPPASFKHGSEVCTYCENGGPKPAPPEAPQGEGLSTPSGKLTLYGLGDKDLEFRRDWKIVWLWLRFLAMGAFDRETFLAVAGLDKLGFMDEAHAAMIRLGPDSGPMHCWQQEPWFNG